MYGIKINNYIYKLLSTDDNLLKKVKKQNIKPLIQDPTDYPFVSYKRLNITVDYAKDGTVEDIVEVQIICVSDKYDESVDIAQTVRDRLDNKVYKDDSVFISEIRLDDVTEDVIENAYCQNLFFTFKLQSVN